MEYIDALKLTSGELNKALQNLIDAGAEQITVRHSHSMQNVCVGLKGRCDIRIEEGTGLYTGSFMEGPAVTVEENVGWYAGDNMMSGQLLVRKNTGCNVGAYICGGDIVVYGSTGSRVGYGMKGGNILVCGSSGRWGAYMATGGNLIVLGKLGPRTAESMYQGAVFTRDRGAENQIGGNVFLDDITENEVQHLAELFQKYEVEAKPAEFKVIRPVLTGRHKYVLFHPVLDMAGKSYQTAKGRSE